MKKTKTPLRRCLFYKKILKYLKKRLTYFAKYDIILLLKGGEEMANNKKKSNKDFLISALIDFTIGLLLLIIDKIIQ